MVGYSDVMGEAVEAEERELQKEIEVWGHRVFIFHVFLILMAGDPEGHRQPGYLVSGEWFQHY